MTTPIKTYLTQLRQARTTGTATEHTHRPALAALLQTLDPGHIKAINEPRRIACGAPDLAVLKDSFLVGHIEAKDIGIALDTVERSEQLKRYRDALPNLILTDYVEFRWYVAGEHRQTARLARLDRRGNLKADPKGLQAVSTLLRDFIAHTPQAIATPRELAERLARLAHLIREIIVTAFETDKASPLLRGWRQAFAQVLVAGLDQPERVRDFADMFAQTLAYGLFSARVMDEAHTPFTRARAQHLIPRTNPFLRDFFYQITGPQLEDEPFAGFVEDLVQLLAQADIDEILRDFGKRTRQQDPIVHFYETFLAAYDARLRAARGVYYTPAPVVSFIVRSVDALLKSHFNLPQGLADTSKVTVKNTEPGLRVKGKTSQIRKTTEIHKVLILDPATGTATFPYAVIDHIRSQFMQQNNAGMWSGYVREHLLPRIFGFELLMAPYAVAHFKLALQLAGHDLDPEQRAQWAYDFGSDERLGIYLTNALEGPHEHTGLPIFTQFLADESAAANEIKRDLPIMIVMGNPPYSGHSSNKGKWIANLLKGKLPNGEKTTSYYEVDGKPLGERNSKWLQDDYVKFIRFGQWRIEQSGGGILAFISNNGYLDNPTFRGMRQSLMETFTEIYLLDLHGNARKKESTPDGGPDENVFDIMQGVAIALFIKEPGKTDLAKVHHADLWGKRDAKYRSLGDGEVGTLQWETLQPQKPFYLFVPQDVNLLTEYRQGMKINDVFSLGSMGVTTARDRLTIHWSAEQIWRTVQDFIVLSVEDARQKYVLGKDARDWKVNLAQEDIRINGPNQDSIQPILYRPFDIRYTYYTGKTKGFICMPRREVMRNMRSGENIALCFIRRGRGEDIAHFFIGRHIIDKTILSSLDNANVAPLYLYPKSDTTTLFDTAAMSPWPPDPAHGNRVPNLAPAFVKALEEKLQLRFEPHPLPSPEIGEDRGAVFGPEDILAYIYAVFHSPTYRQRYAEFLKIDFPRVPLTSDVALFWHLVSLGKQLIALHLLDLSDHSMLTTYPIPGNNEVLRRGGYPKYTPPNPAQDIGGRVHINKSQYFEGIAEEVWAFQVGGYQVLHKWLKDRRGRVLTFDDLTHYQKIVVALHHTRRLMDEVDGLIPGWPIS